MKVLIINGHPDLASFTSKISNSIYDKYRKSGSEVVLLNLASLDFDPNYKGYSEKDNLEESILEAQKLISNAGHIIITTPIWWSTYPALLKGFFDKVLAPGFAYKYKKGSAIPLKLLKGRSAELVLLSDAPAWYRKYVLRDPAAKILKRDILGFCGIKVKKVRRIGSVGSLSEDARNKILEELRS